MLVTATVRKELGAGLREMADGLRLEDAPLDVSLDFWGDASWIRTGL